MASVHIKMSISMSQVAKEKKKRNPFPVVAALFKLEDETQKKKFSYSLHTSSFSFSLLDLRCTVSFATNFYHMRKTFLAMGGGPETIQDTLYRALVYLGAIEDNVKQFKMRSVVSDRAKRFQLFLNS